MSKNENSLNFRMTDETAAKIERWYQKDNCRSKNEFIEKAVNCYADMLAAGESTALPRAVQSAIDSRLKLFENRIASLLYKQAVEMDMAMSILLQSVNVSEEALLSVVLRPVASIPSLLYVILSENGRNTARQNCHIDYYNTKRPHLSYFWADKWG